MSHGLRATGATLFAILLSSSAQASTNWSASGLPTSGSVTIAAGQSIILDQNLTLADLTINGELICADQNLSLSAKWVMVHGRFECGTKASRFTSNFTLTLTGTASDPNQMGMGTKFLGAMGGGQIELHGEARKGWTRLAKSANKGATTIALKEALPWRVGDRIVLVSTDYHWDHGEERTITAISGKTVTLNAPLQYQHYCAIATFGAKSIEECGEVGLATRNIVLKGDAASATSFFGGHVMVMAGSSAKIDGVQFLNMGQKGIVGRYPFHWHMAGNVAGQYIDNSSVIHSFNRFITVHGSHNAHVGGNFAYDTIGHGYYLEDGIETGNVIEDNLGAKVRNSTGGLPTPSDKQAAVFWISNPDNTVRRNVSAGSENSGFWLGFPDNPIGLSTTTTVFPRRTPLKEFSDNVSHSNNSIGLNIDRAENKDRITVTTWYEPRQNPADGNSAIVPPVFKNYTGYKNRGEAIWLRSSGQPVVQSPKLANNSMGAFFASLSGKPGYIQDGLVAGETGNKGNPESWEKKGLDGRELFFPWDEHVPVRGLQFYDGPMTIRRTKFVNFQSNAQRKAGGLTNLSPNPFWFSSVSASSEITFDNANRVWLRALTPKNDGESFSVFRDRDGSVTGIAGRMVVPPNPVLITASCTRKVNWNAYVCPHNYVGVQVYANNGENITGTKLIRNDGKQRVIGSPGSSTTGLHINILESRPHHLVFPSTPPKKLTFVRREMAGKAVRLSLDYPTSNFTFKLWGSQPVPKVTSLSALTSGGTKYYFDAAAKRIHMRLVSDDGDYKGYELLRP